MNSQSSIEHGGGHSDPYSDGKDQAAGQHLEPHPKRKQLFHNKVGVEDGTIPVLYVLRSNCSVDVNRG